MTQNSTMEGLKSSKLSMDQLQGENDFIKTLVQEVFTDEIKK